MKQDRIRRALSTVEQGREWPSRGWARPSRFLKGTDLCGISIVAFQDAAEFALTTNFAFGCRNEGLIKDSVVPTDPVWSKYSAEVQNSYSVVHKILNRVGFGSTCVSIRSLHGRCYRLGAKETKLSFALTSDLRRETTRHRGSSNSAFLLAVPGIEQVRLSNRLLL